MDVDCYPAGSRVEVWWPNENEWYSATVLKTRPTVPHMTDGSAGVICQELLCYYDLDDHIQWHSLHDNDVRSCTSPFTTEDDSGIADPFPIGTRMQVWWPGDSSYYIATVLKTRVALHIIKRLKTLCREIFCEYELDGLMQWHSLHNNNVRSASGVCISLFALPVHIQTQCDTQNTQKTMTLVTNPRQNKTLAVVDE